MATTATAVTTQLAQTQTNTTTPSLEQRKLARFLASCIHYHNEEFFHKMLERGADPHFSGLNDHDEYTRPHLFNAISFFNTWAFDTLLERNVDIHKAEKGGTTPLFSAVAVGNVHMVRKLLEKGADPLDYNDGTCLTLAIESLRSGALLESQSSPLLKSRWRYEDEPLSKDNAELEKQISDFFHQREAYAPPKSDQAIPFVGRDKAIHVHFKGKQEVLGLLLNKYHVSPLIPVATTKRTPLKVVKNPKKYAKAGLFQGDSDEELQFMGSEDGQESTLIFTMKFRNKRYTGSIPIVVHYDFKPAQKLIESAIAHLSPDAHALTQSLSTKMEQGIRETGSRLDTLSSIQAKLITVQEQLSEETTHLTQEMKSVKDTTGYDKKQEIEHFVSLIKGHPNAQIAYTALQVALTAIHTSALAVKGGLAAPEDPSLSLVSTVLDISKGVVAMIPMVGEAASKLFELASSAATEVGRVRQTNLFENIAAMIPPAEAQEIFETVARKLTQTYFRQFERLFTEEMAKAQMSRLKQSVQNTKEKTLNSRFIPPAEQVTKFAVLMMMETVFSKAHLASLQQEIREKGLETVLLNAVTQHKPSEKLTRFWDLITDGLPMLTESGTISNETWSPDDFWTKPGVAVQNSTGWQCFGGANTDAARLGYRLGNLEDVRTLGLTPTAGITLPPHQYPQSKPSTANSDFAPSRSMLHAYANAPKPAAINSNTANNVVSSVSPSPHETVKPKDVQNPANANACSVPSVPLPHGRPVPKQDLPTSISVAKRNKSPFARVREVCAART